MQHIAVTSADIFSTRCGVDRVFAVVVKIIRYSNRSFSKIRGLVGFGFSWPSLDEMWCACPEHENPIGPETGKWNETRKRRTFRFSFSSLRLRLLSVGRSRPLGPLQLFCRRRGHPLGARFQQHFVHDKRDTVDRERPGAHQPKAAEESGRSALPVRLDRAVPRAAVRRFRGQAVDDHLRLDHVKRQHRYPAGHTCATSRVNAASGETDGQQSVTRPVRVAGRNRRFLLERSRVRMN